jgi:hypothetical protein
VLLDLEPARGRFLSINKFSLSSVDDSIGLKRDRPAGVVGSFFLVQTCRVGSKHKSKTFQNPSEEGEKVTNRASTGPT